MLVDPLCLAVTALLSVLPPTGAPRAIPVRPDTTQVPLTDKAMTHLATFWTAFLKEPPAVRDSGKKANQETVALGIPRNVKGDEVTLTVVNMVAMANQFPSVAADLKAAGLTPPQWEAYRKAVLAAALADQMEKLSPTEAAPLIRKLPVWKNVEFLRAHPKAYYALVAAGMWIPKIGAGGGGGGMGGGMGGGGDDIQP